MSHLSSTIGPNQLVSSVYLNMRVVRIRFTISEEGNRFKSDEVALQVQFSGEPALQFPAPHERRWCLQVVRFLTSAALLTDPFVGRSWSGLDLLTRVDLRTARSTPWAIRCRRVRDIKILQRHVHPMLAWMWWLPWPRYFSYHAVERMSMQSCRLQRHHQRSFAHITRNTIPHRWHACTVCVNIAEQLHRRSNTSFTLRY